MNYLAWAVYSAPLGLKNQPRIRRKAEYRFIDLIRPDCYEPYTIEQRFGVLRWMVETAYAIEPTKAETGQWGASNALCLLNCHPTCVNDSELHAISNLADLKSRFYWALLSRLAGASAIRWRRKDRVNVTASRILEFPHYVPFAGAPLQGSVASEADIEKTLKAMFESSSPLTVQLNEFHAAATENYGVRIRVRPQGFQFILDYGYEGSIWNHTLAETPNMWEGSGETFHYNPYGRKSETFIATMDRAVTALNALLKAREVEAKP